MQVTFLASAPKRIGAAKLSQLRKLVREAGQKYWLKAYSDAEMANSRAPAYALAITGAREQADPELVAAFKRLTA